MRKNRDISEWTVNLQRRGGRTFHVCPAERQRGEVVINSFSDQVQSLGCMQEGSFFGEMSLLEEKPRTATIVADSEETVVLERSGIRLS